MDDHKKEKGIYLAIFEGKQIRRHWDDRSEKWFFSVVDVISALTRSGNPQVYWRVMKKRLIDEGSVETVTKCNGLKMVAPDGKMRLTDAADTEVMLRLVQSIPSPNAEPFKLWLARVGYERLEETADPELAILRALKTYLAKGYSLNWINQRLKAIEIRKELTDEWERSGVNDGFEFAILTDEITKAWTGMTTREYKNLKDLKKENLRDNMSNLELVLNMLAETATTEISRKEEPKGLDLSKKIAKRGGSIAGTARRQIEKETGRLAITSENWRVRRSKLIK
ncbi:MAG: Bro-N domain-containing protein [Candidatus Taylorbacteria bacterium]